MPKRSNIIALAIAVLGSLSLSSNANAVNNGNLTLEIDGLQSQQGNVCLSIFDRSQGFPTNSSNAVKTACYPITETPLKITLKELNFGSYAVALFHDENTDGELNTNIVGIPQEGFGFSNNPPLRPRPAEFGEAMFLVGGQNTNIQIMMKYLRGL